MKYCKFKGGWFEQVQYCGEVMQPTSEYIHYRGINHDSEILVVYINNKWWVETLFIDTTVYIEKSTDPIRFGDVELFDELPQEIEMELL